MNPDLDYNTARPQLPLPEYGRHVQRMVDLCLEQEDRAQRTRIAHAIIQVIGRLNPQLRGSENADRTLWDHLHIMSGLQLEVDGPYPKPTAEELETKPERVPYPKQEIRYGHYGKLTERMIDSCKAMPEGAEKEAYTRVIANHMKKQFLVWNRDSVGDGVIIKDLTELSKGALRLKPDQQLTATDTLLQAQRTGPRNEVDTKKRHNNNGGNGGGGNKKRHRNRKKGRY